MKIKTPEFRVQEDWGSQSVGYRMYIRRSLKEQFGDLLITDALDLETIPKLNAGYVSISHTQELGGYSWSEDPIGFDVERKGRASEKALRRVCHSSELESAPGLTELWCAKEASFKSLYLVGKEIKFISELEIIWRERDKFQIKDSGGKIGGRGQIHYQDQFVLAFFEI